MFSSIRSRVIGATAAIVIVSLLINTAVNYLIINQFNNSAVEDSLTALTKSYTVAIDQWVTSQEKMINSISPHVTDDNPLPLLKQVVDAGGFMNVVIGFPDKRVLSADPSAVPEGSDPTGRSWYIQAAQGKKPLVTKPYLDLGTKKLVVTVAAPAINNGELTGVVEGDIMMDHIVAAIRDIKPTPNSFGMLMVNDGTIIAHPDKSLMLKKLKDVVPGLNSSMLINASGIIQASINGQIKLLKALPVGKSGWYTVVVMDKQEATAGLRSLLTASVICLFCLIVFAIIIANIICKRALSPLDHIREAMANIAAGDADLTRRLDEGRDDEVADIARAFNQFISTLGVIMTSVRQTSHTVRSASQEIAVGNQNLFVRTESAAASLQQTSVAVGEISSAVSLTSDTIEQANQAIVNTLQAAGEGGAAVKGVTHAIDDIQQASGKIAEATGVIESIAFQSNILALNATVEAAHAGEIGKGFAVVAGEVRNLANRSSQAAKEIKALIDMTVESIHTGSQQVRHTNQKMEHIVSSVSEVTSMMAEITNATREQKKGIQEINHVLTQLDVMVRENTSLVEESTSASTAVQTQATELSNAVEQFKL